MPVKYHKPPSWFTLQWDLFFQRLLAGGAEWPSEDPRRGSAGFLGSRESSVT